MATLVGKTYSTAETTLKTLKCQLRHQTEAGSERSDGGTEGLGNGTQRTVHDDRRLRRISSPLEFEKNRRRAAWRDFDRDVVQRGSVSN
jgi:hypothetical protein